MKLKIIIVGLLLLLPFSGFSQPTLSTDSKISILTVGTADELYAKFGHSAIRVQDPILGIDVVYNYGYFDFNTPNFYVKFTQGKLLYQLVRQSFTNFIYEYEIENRWVREQTLNLSQEEQNSLFVFLEKNHLPENRYYKYDFLFDNCSTRIPEGLKLVLKDKVNFDYSNIENQYTFRELIHQNLETNSWSNFGIDLALGSVIDEKATPWENQFLPIYVYQQLPYTTINGKPLIANDKLLLDEKPMDKNSNFLLSPLFWLSLILIVILFITYKDFNNNTRNKTLDFLLFFITGIAGLLIIFLWFGTDHKATANNYNFLWTFPLNIIIAFLVLKKGAIPKWLSAYLIALLVFIFIAMLIWILKVQVFSVLIIPIVLALAVRYSFLIYTQRSVRVH